MPQIMRKKEKWDHRPRQGEGMASEKLALMSVKELLFFSGMKFNFFKSEVDGTRKRQNSEVSSLGFEKQHHVLKLVLCEVHRSCFYLKFIEVAYIGSSRSLSRLANQGSYKYDAPHKPPPSL